MNTLHLGLAAIGGKNWMGGTNYVRNLAEAVHAAAPETALSWICGEPLKEDFREVTPRWPVPMPGRLDRLLGRQPGRVRRVLETACVDFLYPLTYDNAYNLGLHFPLRRAMGGCRWAGWIPDFQHRHLPELCSPQEHQRRERNIARLVQEAPRIVLSSQDALRDFQQFYPEYREKGTVLNFCSSPLSPGTEEVEDAVPERFLLVCNQFWKHKNHALVFSALKLLQERGVRPLVLCTGALSDYRNNDHIGELRGMLTGLGEQVRMLGLVPRERLTALLRRAVAVVQPSLFEGWSTVVEDARSLGRRCLLSDLAVHREQNPPGAQFFPPHDAEALAGLMAEAWRDWPAGPDPTAEAAAQEEGRRRQVETGRQFLTLAQAILAGKTGVS